MSYLGKWDKWYANILEAEPYGDTITYGMGAEFLSDCASVEDWGCGKGWFSKFYSGEYIGVDGTKTPFSSVVADLTEYHSSVEGIFMRHVIEHNQDWKHVLDNALSSFTRKMFLVLFTPFQKKTQQIAFVSDIGVPDIAFAKKDITTRIESAGATWDLKEAIPTDTAYGVEHVFFITR